MENIRPANKFLTNSPFKQLRHMSSELWEVFKALVKYSYNPTCKNLFDLTSEIIDLQFSAQTMMEGSLDLTK